ncbi:MAG: helix-turn-helix transcriptional regulator [Oscillospiraceae bacterium]|nr:helix-turn-helix transcriptional regulator [Oscillospiraceae bacterium]
MNEIGTRIYHLRDYRCMTNRELAGRIGISESQLSRIERGKTATVSSDILTGLSREFKVSADYILGLSPTKENSHVLSELRLSEAACEKLVRREIDGETLSRLMEQKEFESVVRLSRAYFTDVYAEGTAYRNTILEVGASFLRDHAAETDHAEAVRVKAGDVVHAKTRDHEIEFTQIQRLMKKALAGAKAQYEQEQAEHDPALKRRFATQQFAARLREIAEEVHAAEGTEEEKLDRLTDRMMDEIQHKCGLPDWAAKPLKPIYKRIIRATGKTGQKTEDEAEIDAVE